MNRHAAIERSFDSLTSGPVGTLMPESLKAGDVLRMNPKHATYSGFKHCFQTLWLLCIY